MLKYAQMVWSPPSYAEWPKVADAVIEAEIHNTGKSGKFHNTLRYQRQWRRLTVQSNIPL
jgi:hypothetical protein